MNRRGEPKGRVIIGQTGTKICLAAKMRKIRKRIILFLVDLVPFCGKFKPGLKRI
jgi:hypothetical protein